MLLACNGIWIVNGKFGCTWKAEQIRINPPVGFDDFSIMDDSDEEEKLEKIETDYVKDSSSESEEEEEVKPKKKVVRKKKTSD